MNARALAMHPRAMLAASKGNGVTSAAASPVQMAWSDIVALFVGKPPRLGKLTSAQYASADKAARQADKDGPWFILGTFKNNHRHSSTWEQTGAITLDHDAGTLSEEEIRASLAGHAAIVSTTHSHTPERPKWRIILPLVTPISDREQYKATVAAAERLFPDGTEFDSRSRLPEQLWFAPSCPVDAAEHYRAFALEGAPFAPVAVQPTRVESPKTAQPDSFEAEQRRREVRDLLDRVSLEDAMQRLGVSSRDAWVKIGMSAKSYEPRAGDIFAEWSAQQPGYAGDADCSAQWASFDKSGTAKRVTIDTLRSLARGVRALASDFTAAPASAANDAPATHAAAEPFPFVEAKRHDTSAPRPFIVKGLAAPGRVIEFLGKPGNSKTALLCHTAKCIARGAPWFAKATKRYAVVVVASEGRQDVLDRLKGYDAIHGEQASEAPILVLSRVNFSSNDERDRLVTTIAAIERAYGVKVGALMVDTLAASTAGDENDTAVMRDAAQRIRSVAEQFELAAFVTHHPTKSNEETSRGAGAWLGAIDQQIFVKKHGGSFELSGGKQRQSGLGRSRLAYDLESASAGTWEDGDVIGVPVVRERGAVSASDFQASAAGQGEEMPAAADVGPSAKRVINDLCRALQTAQKAAGGAAVSARAWRATYSIQQGISASGAGSTFRRHLPRLLAGLVNEAGGLYSLAKL